MIQKQSPVPAEGRFLTHGDGSHRVGHELVAGPAHRETLQLLLCPETPLQPGCVQGTPGQSRYELVGESGHFRGRRDTEKLDSTLATSNLSKRNATCHTP